MEVRYPTFDLTGFHAHWAPNHEFAQHVNATGIIPTAIEPFLIKVFRRAKAELDPVADAQLIADVDIFIKQEAQHYKIHGQFNDAVAADGYPGILDHDNKLKADYAEFLETKDIEWLLGYCDAFESIVAVGVAQWVDLGWGDYLTGADERALRLWRWHLAEEYEHRTVAHRLYHRVVKGTPDEVYHKRMDTMAFYLQHLEACLGATREYLLSVDRQSMSEQERAASIARIEEIDGTYLSFMSPIEAVMAPTWDPESLPRPARLDEAFALVG